MSKVKTIKGIEVQRGDKELENLLSAWVKAIVRYTTANEYDNPWWYNERASLSVLAGAAWTLKNWFALEEFSTLKRHRTLEPGVDSGSLRHGRCDLFVQSPNTSFAIEAKQTVQSIGARSDGYTFAERAIRKAWADSGDLSNREAYRRFAVTFIVPYIPTSEVRIKEDDEEKVCPRKVEQAIKDWLTDQPSFLGASMKRTDFAFIFPQLGNQHYSLNEKYYPGVVIVFEERYRAHRRQMISAEQVF
ncbi:MULTISPECIES: hypothetical protein [Pectobacterium]|uniref:hypothetical protein n=1 Tax=Pectobacterium TaxID=122277 RepID=UPI000D72CF1B|nr:MULTISPECIES: hypothetical protein [Pectobacterium]PXB00289.1 hypothetical protein DMB41_20500 [Pectobacterium carotovorum subsp. carotovorum]